jgi:hypothetical protein
MLRYDHVVGDAAVVVDRRNKEARAVESSRVESSRGNLNLVLHSVIDFIPRILLIFVRVYVYTCALIRRVDPLRTPLPDTIAMLMNHGTAPPAPST